MLLGAYTLYPGEERELIVPNSIVQDGLPSLLAMMLQADNSIVAGGANFYMGLCTDTSVLHSMATLIGEPSGNGYSRQAVNRSASGWPLIEILNGNGHARTATVTFGCTGSNYNVSVSNIFLCSAAFGTGGKLFSFSASLPAPVQLTPGQTLPVAFDLFVN